MTDELVNRRGLLLGGGAMGSAVAMSTAVMAASRPPGDANTGKLPDSAGGFSDAMKAGARADGHTDDQPVLQKLFNGLREGDVVSFPPGRYHLTQPLTVTVDSVTLLGHGAFFDRTLVLHAKELRVVGLSIMGAPGHGFHIMNGQGGYYESLSAHENGGAGFLLGGADGAQIAWASFNACNALRNKSHGWFLDGLHKKCWVNANTFSACWSRGNGACGWKSQGWTNYNTWLGTQVENNCKDTPTVAPVVLDGGDNFFYGGHVVDTRKCGTSVSFRPNRGSMIFGGRYIGSVVGAAYTQAVVINAMGEKVMIQMKRLRHQRRHETGGQYGGNDVQDH